MLGVPGMTKPPMSTLVVTPTLAEYAIASSVPCRLSAKVWIARSALKAASEGPFAAMLPFAPTVTPLLVKKLLPSVLVADGPVNELNTSTGLLGAAASSSASVGRRFSANCAGVQPPMAVVNSPGFPGWVRARIGAWPAAVERAVYHRVSRARRRTRRREWMHYVA